MPSPFLALSAITSNVIHGVHGVPARLLPRRRDSTKGPNAPRQLDPTRADTDCLVIRSESPERFDTSDNGIGRNPGMMRVPPTGLRCLVTFPAGMATAPRKGDQITFDDRPGLVYELGETLAGDLPGATFAYSLRG